MKVFHSEFSRCPTTGAIILLLLTGCAAGGLEVDGLCKEDESLLAIQGTKAFLTIRSGSLEKRVRGSIEYSRANRAAFVTSCAPVDQDFSPKGGSYAGGFQMQFFELIESGVYDADTPSRDPSGPWGDYGAVSQVDGSFWYVGKDGTEFEWRGIYGTNSEAKAEPFQISDFRIEIAEVKERDTGVHNYTQTFHGRAEMELVATDQDGNLQPAREPATLTVEF